MSKITRSIKVLVGDLPVSDATPQGIVSKAKSSNFQSSSHQVGGLDSLHESLLNLGSWVEKNAATVAALLGAVIVAGIGFGIWSWWHSRVELKAQDAYYAVETKYSKIKEGFDRAKFSAFMPPTGSQTKDQPATGDLNKDYGTIPSELESFAKEYAGTSAGTQAAILVADLYLSYKQPEKAAQVAEIGASSLSKSRILTQLAMMSWGSALADKGDCKAAVGVWQQVIDNAKATPLHSDAFLRSGLCHEVLNDPAKARELYQKVIAQAGNSSTATTAKGLLRALDVKAN